MALTMRPRLIVAVSLTAFLAACGGGGGGSSTAPTDSVSGTLSGFTSWTSATQLTLQDNGGDNLILNKNGTFTFSQGVTSGSSYAVTVLTPPPNETCTVANGTGSATTNVTTVQVSCTVVAPAETILHSFGVPPDGEYPEAGLIMDTNGNFFGTTAHGGTAGYGTVFELAKGTNSYTETILHSFGSGTDGQNPRAGLIMDANGNLYGTTSNGGTAGYGTVFELAPSNGSYTETVLHSFGATPDGQYPEAGLIMDASGNLYGTTSDGGTAGGYGTVFELAKGASGYTETVLHSFGSGTDGQYPEAGFIMDASGNLYGTTYQGGSSGYGTVFELVKGASGYTETVLNSFTGTNGQYPEAGLIMDASGNLYGTTYGGGTAGGYGTVFEITP